MTRKSIKNLFNEQNFSIYKAVLDQSSEGFTLMDSTGRYVGVNQAFCDLTGYSESELLAMSLMDLVSREVAHGLLPNLSEGSYCNQGIEILRKDGMSLCAHWKGSIITYNEQSYYLGIVSDMTDQNAAEGNLKLSEDKYRVLFDAAPDPIVIHDGNTILDINQATLAALSLTEKKQMIGQHPFTLLHPDDRILAMQRLKQLREKCGAIEPAEFRMLLPNNEKRLVIATPIPIDYDGQPAFMVIYHDITERKATYDELISAKEFAENLMETANTMVIAFDSEARITIFNKFAEELTGYDKSEVIGKNWFELFIPQRDRAAIPKLFSDVLRHLSTSSRNENHILLKGGEERLISWSNNVMLSGSGAAQGVLSIGMDITERKYAEEALRISEEHYRSVVQDQSEYIVRYAPDGVITFVNDSYCRAFHTSPEEVMGTNVTRGLLGVEISRIKKKIQALTPEYPIVVDEHETITPDGHKVWHLWSDRGIFNEHGLLREVQAVGRDITKRKQLEESLYASATQLEEAQRLANMGSYILDMQANTWTPSHGLAHIFGIQGSEPREVVQWLELVHPEERSDIEAYFQGLVAEKGQYFDKQYRVIRASDGVVRWVHGLGEFVFDTSHNHVKMIGVIQDITERKLAGDEREQALLDARMANQVKDQFIANISHEIRTPLNSILGFSDILNQRYNELINKQDENIFDYINQAGLRLIRTVDSILNIAQLEAGAVKIHPKEIDLVSMAHMIVEESRPVAEKKGLTIVCISTLEVAKVWADEYCIHQAITNLTENAIKFTSAGSIKIDIRQQGRGMALSVMDSGIGISEDYQKRLYETYTQASEGFTKNFQGVGLGMALTKRYADLNDVEIKLKSEEGVGTTVILIFPALEGEG